MRLEDLEATGGKVKGKNSNSTANTCDPRLPCHYGGRQSEAATEIVTKILERPTYGNEMPTPSSEYAARRRWNPDSHLGAVESERWEDWHMPLSGKDRDVLRSHGFRVPAHFADF